MAYAEIENAALDLAPYAAGWSDLSWPRAGLRPVPISGGTARLVGLQLAFRGVHGFSLTAQFVQANTYGREVIGSARSGRVSSHPLGRGLLALRGRAGGAGWQYG
jgi:hypothetical protein